MRKVFLLVSAMLTVTAMLSCIKDNTLSMNQDNPGPSTDVDNTEQTIILSVRHCGAVADGVTLDTQAIQSAIDRVSSSGGGTVLVPSDLDGISGTAPNISHLWAKQAAPFKNIVFRNVDVPALVECVNAEVRIEDGLFKKKELSSEELQERINNIENNKNLLH